MTQYATTPRHFRVFVREAKAAIRYATESEMDQAEEELVRQIGALLRWEV